jgi:hypothetical protein
LQTTGYAHLLQKPDDHTFVKFSHRWTTSEGLQLDVAITQGFLKVHCPPRGDTYTFELAIPDSIDKIKRLLDTMHQLISISDSCELKVQPRIMHSVVVTAVQGNQQAAQIEGAFGFSDEEVPDILIAFADGIEEDIDKWFPGTMSRMNNHDLTDSSKKARQFAPMFSLFFGDQMLFVGIGAECVEFWDQTCIKQDADGNNATIVPLCQLEYTDPNLLQQIRIVVTRHFEIEKE